MEIKETVEQGHKWLNALGISEVYPFIENGLVRGADTVERVYFNAIFAYETFQLLEKTSKDFSVNEQRNIANILRFQKEIGAYYAPFQTSRSLTTEEIKSLSQHDIRHKLMTAYKKNRGIYYVSGLQAFTSTLIYENPEIVKRRTTEGKAKAGVPFKKRDYGPLYEIVPKTLKLFDGSTSIFTYPFMLNGIICEANRIYDIYMLVYRWPGFVDLAHDRTFYSSQEKKIFKQVKSIGEVFNGGKVLDEKEQKEMQFFQTALEVRHEDV